MVSKIWPRPPLDLASLHRALGHIARNIPASCYPGKHKLVPASGPLHLFPMPRRLVLQLLLWHRSGLCSHVASSGRLAP